MKDNGFTLIELLAVIVILAIIALISAPVITNLIENSRKESFRNSAYGIARAGEISFGNDSMNLNAIQTVFTYNDGVETADPIDKKLDYNGIKPETGRIIVNNQGQVALAIHNGKYCAEKSYEDQEITLSEKTKDECTISVPIPVAARHPLPVNKTCSPYSSTGACFSEIVLLPFSYSIFDYLKSDGRVLQIAQNATLYSLIGITYGGDGVTTFSLPNLTGSSPLAGLNYYITVSGNIPNWIEEEPLLNGSYNYFSYKTSPDNYLLGEVILASNVDESEKKLLRCDGRLLNIASNPALYSILGVTFGGNGTTTFALPNLTSATSPVDGLSYYMVVDGIYPSRD